MRNTDTNRTNRPRPALCQVLHDGPTRCDQCNRRTWRPHISGGRTFCRRCCPLCATAVLTGPRQGPRNSVRLHSRRLESKGGLFYA